MTVQEFYSVIGGGYEEMLAKFRSDDRIIRFVGMFVRDTSFQGLAAALEQNDCQQAFASAHTLKGVAMNLCLHDMIEQAVKITEALRGGDLALAKMLFPDVEETYLRTISAAKQLQ